MSSLVSSSQRFTRRHPCPVCGGHNALPGGRGLRCYGFLSSDGRFAHCTREECAGALELEPDAETYPHRLDGSCPCGIPHAEPGYAPDAEPRARPEAREGYRRPAPPAEKPGDLPPDILRWFARRGIPDWVLHDFGITAGPTWMPQFEKEVTAVRFPYLRNGELINVKYRAQPKAFRMEAGAERILYNLDAIEGAEEVVIVEGELDALTIATVHGPPAVSVPDGAPSETSRDYASKFAFLADPVAEARLAAARSIVIGTDMDAPGRRLADELARRLGHGRCKRAHWPEKDANETLVKHGVAAVCEAIAAAQPWPVAGVWSVNDLAADVLDLHERGFDRGRDVDWPAFDRLYRARAGLVTVVTGQPGDGKSVFVDNLITRLALRHGWTFAVCSPENQPLARHVAGLASVYLGLPFWDGPNPRMTRADLEAALPRLDKHFAFVLPDEPTIENIIERAEVLVYRKGISGLVVDPFNELDHAHPASVSKTDFVSGFLRKLRNFARRRNVHVWLVAHPTKLQKGKDGRYPVPTLYDVSDSAHFRNKADYGLSVWRPHAEPGEPARPTQVHIQKIRFAETGELGMAEFRFDKPTGRFYEAGQRGPMAPRLVTPEPAPLAGLLPSEQPDPWSEHA